MQLLQAMQFPIIQGPMAGGACTPELVAGVSNAGGLGSLAASLLSPETMAVQIARICALTSRPFLVNLFVQNAPAPSEAELEQAARFLKPVLDRLGMEVLPRPAKWCEDFEAQFAALLELKPAAASFTFDILRTDQVARLHGAGITVIGTATTVAEAQAWEAVGADAVVASGIEAGGHRGTFLVDQEAATLSGPELWPLAAQAVGIPVIAAGAIMEGADIHRALQLGASAVQMGTAFLVCDESGIHAAYKERLTGAAAAGTAATRLSRAFSGRYARGLDNLYMQWMSACERQMPAYPVTNALTTPLRAAAAERRDTELMSLWAGTGVGRARPMPVAALMALLGEELRSVSLAREAESDKLGT